MIRMQNSVLKLELLHEREVSGYNEKSDMNFTFYSHSTVFSRNDVKPCHTFGSSCILPVNTLLSSVRRAAPTLYLL